MSDEAEGAPGGAAEDGPPAPDATEPRPSEPDSDAAAPTGAEAEPEAAPAELDLTEETDPLELLRVRLGLGAQDDASLRRYLDVLERFEGGDNRSAGRLLGELLASDPPEPLRREAEQLRRRLRPDRVALIVFAVAVIGLLIIWLAALHASHGVAPVQMPEGTGAHS